jgi:hypothetical protein
VKTPNKYVGKVFWDWDSSVKLFSPAPSESTDRLLGRVILVVVHNDVLSSTIVYFTFYTKCLNISCVSLDVPSPLCVYIQINIADKLLLCCDLFISYIYLYKLCIFSNYNS